jgi:ribosomal protein S18 acetylase RimI-like enzyme
MSLLLRPVTAEQTAAYLPMARAAYLDELLASGAFNPERARAKADQDYASLDYDGETTYVAAHEVIDGVEQWVGVLGYGLRGFDDDPATEPALYVYDLEVFEPYRRRGSATALLEHARRVAAAAGAASVRLTVWAGNDGARDLYDAVGFRLEAQQMRLAVDRA